MKILEVGVEVNFQFYHVRFEAKYMSLDLGFEGNFHCYPLRFEAKYMILDLGV